MEDRLLVEDAQRGDRGAFEALVKRYETKVIRLAYGFVKDAATADDLAQDVFVKAYLHLPRFRFDSEFGTWIYRIAVNHIKDHLRKAGRRKEVPLEEAVEKGLSADDPVLAREAEAEAERRKSAVFQTVRTLPPKYATILTLRDVRGLSYEEISGILKISPGTVDSRLHRARRLLRKRMAPVLARESRAGEGGRP